MIFDFRLPSQFCRVAPAEKARRVHRKPEETKMRIGNRQLEIGNQQ